MFTRTFSTFAFFMDDSYRKSHNRWLKIIRQYEPFIIKRICFVRPFCASLLNFVFNFNFTLPVLGIVISAQD